MDSFTRLDLKHSWSSQHYSEDTLFTKLHGSSRVPSAKTIQWSLGRQLSTTSPSALSTSVADDPLGPFQYVSDAVTPWAHNPQVIVVDDAELEAYKLPSEAFGDDSAGTQSDIDLYCLQDGAWPDTRAALTSTHHAALDRKTRD